MVSLPIGCLLGSGMTYLSDKVNLGHEKQTIQKLFRGGELMPLVAYMPHMLPPPTCCSLNES